MKVQLLAILCCTVSLTVVAQKSAPAKDTLTKQYERLLASSSQEDRDLLRSKMYALLQSPHEKDWQTANRFFYQMKMGGTCDSLLKAEKLQFPTGIAERNAEVTKIYDAKDAKEKEENYKQWLKVFPPEKFGEERIIYDYARQDIARQYAKEDNLPKTMEYAHMLETRAWKGEGYAGIAMVLMAKGHLPEAAALLKTAIDHVRGLMTAKDKDPGLQFAAIGYPSYCARYADILYQQKQYNEALQYIRIAHDSTKNVRADINGNYALILAALGKDKEAFDKEAEAAEAGVATPDMKEMMKKLYVKIKGSEEGYETYLAQVNKEMIAHIVKDLPRQMIDLPAPGFTLQDLDGNTVSLADYKGKIIVLDFWSTWCGPCKASFPAMQMAVNKYKDSADVKFLFIHTWEHDDTATAMARRYIHDMKYSFRVLMDLKDKVSGNNNVNLSYKITGIPAKFIIDKQGHIRFRLTGFSGGNDAAVEELSAMISLAERS